MREIILYNLKDFSELAAYTFAGIFFVSLIVYLSEYIEDRNQARAKTKAAEACFSLQIKSALFWVLMFVVSTLYQLLAS
ncbi:MAG: hypothetical protein IPP51_01760 [Bacteroidetes bacterium]|nr:hypothetical protein [Bacteroidota bacterium]